MATRVCACMARQMEPYSQDQVQVWLHAAWFTLLQVAAKIALRGQRNRIMMGNSALAFSQKHFGWQVKWQAETERKRETHEKPWCGWQIAKEEHKKYLSDGKQGGKEGGRNHLLTHFAVASVALSPAACRLSLLCIMWKWCCRWLMCIENKNTQPQLATNQSSVSVCVWVWIEERTMNGSRAQFVNTNRTIYYENLPPMELEMLLQVELSWMSLHRRRRRQPRQMSNARNICGLLPAGNVTFAFAKALNESPLRLQL